MGRYWNVLSRGAACTDLGFKALALTDVEEYTLQGKNCESRKIVDFFFKGGYCCRRPIAAEDV